MLDNSSDHGFVICWQCREVVAPTGPACPRCRADIHPGFRQQSLFDFVNEQGKLRNKRVHGTLTRIGHERRRAWLETVSGPEGVRAVFESLGTDPAEYTVIGGWTSVGGYGWSVSEAGRRLVVAISPVELLMIESDMITNVRVPLNRLHTLEMSGGAKTTGGGFIGGGFGLEGAAQGMIVAAVLNSLTTKTKVNTLVYVAAQDGEAILHHGIHTPESLRILLSPAFGALSARRHSAEVTQAGHGGIDPIERLERLVKLRDAGVLTDGEYETARARLVSELTGN